MSPKAKGKLVQIAERSQTTVSHVIRDMIARVATRHVDEVSLRQSMATVRQLANGVLAVAETLTGDPTSANRLADLGYRIRHEAVRHLGPVA